VSEPPTVQAVHPEIRDIIRYVDQPSFIESFERASIYPKVMAYIKEWNVDIGDKVKAGDILCTLYAPELVEDFSTKTATVELDKERIRLAEKVVKVTEADVDAAAAHLEESKAIVAKYQAEVDRWDVEVKRLTVQVEKGIVDPQILLESTNEWKSAVAARNAANSSVDKAKADLLSEQAALEKARVDVAVARADLAVAESAAKYAKAWVDYLTLTAPFDGIIVTRNANRGDFVLPLAGDPTAMQRSPHLAPGGTAAPIYVVDRTDIVRIFVDIPEQDANDVGVGTNASVLVEAFSDTPINGAVTRTSWALNVKSRTLRAEIDVPNTDSQLLPGMYAYAEVVVRRPGVRALPLAAMTNRGDRSFYWALEHGTAVRTEVQTDVSDGEWIEVTNRRVPGASSARLGRRSWRKIDGSERVILGDLSILSDGAPVRVAPRVRKTDLARGN
jgi:multidrug efflux pump subunit AcrA (membrane-fusion protein)